MYGFDLDEDFKLYQQQPKFQVSVENGVCPGCGATFQSIDSAAPGYLPTRGEVEKEQASSSIQVSWKLGNLVAGWPFQTFMALRTQTTNTE